jgi:phospholipid/cholesterol/gamma-HCH transport system substrate-binding protein
MNKKSIEIWVGLFVLLGLGGMVFLALKAANLGQFSANSNTYTLYARFENIGGLKVRAPVRSAGVTVGRVAAIKLDTSRGAPYMGEVRLEVSQDMPFPIDSSAQILTSGLLGDQYVGLEAGGEETNLKAGEVIKQTQSAVVLEKLIGQFLFSKAAEAGSKK